MAIEYEIKLRGRLDELTEALERIGSRAESPRTLEDDLVFDTDEQRILREGGLLRLRRCGGRFLLTLKGSSEQHGEVKAMTEVETEVAELLELVGRRPHAAWRQNVVDAAHHPFPIGPRRGLVVVGIKCLRGT